MGVYQDVYEADENLEDELEDFLDEITHPVESVLSTKQGDRDCGLHETTMGTDIYACSFDVGRAKATRQVS